MPAIPETKTAWTNGVDALNSTNLNAYVRDPIKFLMNPPRAKLRQIAIQTLTTSVLTPITFTAETVDTDVDGIGGHSTSTNTSRYTARYPGWYQASGGVSFGNVSTGIRLLRWAINGSNVAGTDVLLNPVNGNTTRMPARTELVPLDVGDYVELMAQQTTGANLNTVVSAEEQSSMNVLWVGLL
ncbi:hypothetical protein [Micromonospora tarensis]|uniref:Uncharacterized protein n=1 Tax=Micromonospora tarensis TaxID=2806100 RepID=A0ABS1YD30_9ACTN|nr:hypothetical protein [Micromonospora tarensis]MBM0275317.1 hypothetical protein [Micromonospora tarensis]